MSSKCHMLSVISNRMLFDYKNWRLQAEINGISRKIELSIKGTDDYSHQMKFWSKEDKFIVRVPFCRSRQPCIMLWNNLASPDCNNLPVMGLRVVKK